MQLGHLTSGHDLSADDAAIEITGLTSDSRLVNKGFLFAALAGSKTDGARFIPDALAAGARAILVSDQAGLGRLKAISDTAALVLSNDPRREFALAAARFFARQPPNMVAVTGTSGKTSVVTFTQQIFEMAGLSAASIGTLGVATPSARFGASLTTPDPVTLHQQLAQLADQGVTHAAIEASSHGLDQRRLDGIELVAAAFTNLGRDHLDYHADMEDYLAAKMRLFSVLLPSGGSVVVEAGQPFADRIGAIARDRRLPLIQVGVQGNDLRLLQATRDGLSQLVCVEIHGRPASFRFPLIGDFQLTNALVAAGLASACGLSELEILAALPRLSGVPGRLQKVSAPASDRMVVVDYAHKPEALRHALMALKPYAAGRLIVVFGAGGDRDPGKRAMMGAVAAEQADVVIVTDDNPRSEDPAKIRKAILETASGAAEIGDRRKAIRSGLEMMQSGDVLCVAGKGHETGQIIGGEVLPFDDCGEISAWFEEACR